MTDKKTKRDYPVGYGKTPVHSRFQQGQSGNPSGRRKGSKNWRNTLSKELALPTRYVENGLQKKTTKLELIVKQATNKAVKGDSRELLQLIKFFGLDQLDGAGDAVQHALDSVEDAETRESFLLRIQRRKS